MKNWKWAIPLAVLVVAAVVALLVWFPRTAPAAAPGFDGQRAYQDVLAQMAFGPRLPDTPAHAQTVAYITRELAAAGWTAAVLNQPIGGHIALNIVATRDSRPPAILFGAHYDSRMRASNDADPLNQKKPVPGANDGASGVAVLLEIARSLPANAVPVQLVFFDIEDDGEIPGWDWTLGAQAYADSLTARPKVVVVVDMIGDADLNIYMEHNSDAQYTDQIWAAAKSLGYDNAFIPQYKYQVLDDHIPFIQKGLRAVDIIDLDYPYWHTVQDTADKVSAKSLQIVGTTLLAWIKGFPR